MIEQISQNIKYYLCSSLESRLEEFFSSLEWRLEDFSRESRSNSSLESRLDDLSLESRPEDFDSLAEDSCFPEFDRLDDLWRLLESIMSVAGIFIKKRNTAWL